MANQLTLFPQKPLTEADLDDGLATLEIPPDTLQLQVDMLNVVQGLVNIDTFPPDYQEKIKSYYRFSATRMHTQYTKVANVTQSTLDLI